MQAIKISVSEIINSKNAVREKEANLIFELIVSELERNSAVEVDFTGIFLVTSAFLNVAVGRLYGMSQFDEKLLNEKLRFTGLDENDLIIYKRVIQRAKEYFSGNKEKMIESIKDILGDNFND